VFEEIKHVNEPFVTGYAELPDNETKMLMGFIEVAFPF